MNREEWIFDVCIYVVRYDRFVRKFVIMFGGVNFCVDDFCFDD